MDDLSRLKKLRSPTPDLRVEVTSAVLAQIAARQRLSTSALGLMAVGSCAAAATLATIAWQMWSALSDPLAQFFGPVTGVLQ